MTSAGRASTLLLGCVGLLVLSIGIYLAWSGRAVEHADRTGAVIGENATSASSATPATNASPPTPVVDRQSDAADRVTDDATAERSHATRRDRAPDPVQLVTDGIVTGRVVDLAGEPIAGVAVTATRTGLASLVLGVLESDNGPQPQATVTDADGIFRMDLGLSGPFALSFSHDRYATKQRGAVRGRAGDVVELEDIELGSGGAIAGRVTDEAGLPVAAAEVFVVPARDSWGGTLVESTGAPVCTTAADGSFLAEHVVPGPVRVRVSAPGFARVDSERLEVVEGKSISGVDVTLSPGAVIGGRVLDPGGAPVAGARLQAFASGENAMGARMARQLGLTSGPNSVTTDAEGRFEIADLADGAFDVVADVDGLATARIEAVASGTLDLTINMESAGSVAGRVLAANSGKPVSEFEVSLRYGGSDVPMAFNIGGADDLVGPVPIVAADGRFVVENVQPGLYNVAVRARGHAEATVSDVRVTAGQQAICKDFRLEPGGFLQGIVRSAKSKGPVSGARVRAKRQSDSEPGGMRGFILAGGAGRPIDLFGRTENAETAADGTFRIDSLAAGDYAVSVTHPGFVAEEIGTITVDPLAPGGPLQIALRTGGALEGTAFDADGYTLAAARIEVRDESGFFESTSADAYGNYSLGSLAPATYFVKLAADGDSAGGGLMVRSAVMLTLDDGGGSPEPSRSLPKLAVEGIPVDVTEGEIARLDLYAKRKGAIRGMVREAGEAREGVRVQLEKPGPSFAMPTSATSGRGGEYDFDDLEPAEYRVFVRSEQDGRNVFSRDIEVGEGQDVDLDIELPTSFVEGRVMALHGNDPIEGAVVKLREESPGDGMRFEMRIGADEQVIRTDSEGRYRIPSVAAGSYRLTVSKPGFASGSVTGVVVEGDVGTSDVDFKLREGGSIQGVVRSAVDGAPVHFAMIQLADASGSPAFDQQPTISAQDGTFTVPGLAAGSYVLLVGQMGHAQERVPCRVRAGETTEVSVSLSRKD